MNIQEIPFIAHVGVDNDLTLDLLDTNQNHLKSIHAGAQFTLAESASGHYLSSLFPELEDKVIPLLRESSIKFKRQAMSKLTAHPSIEAEDLKKFQTQFTKKGRATIKVAVHLKDQEEKITAIGNFTWYIMTS